MGKLIVLGSASAVPDEEQQNTHLLALAGERAVLIDAGCNPIPELHRVQVPLEHLSDVVLTHFHPDHVSGVPLLLLDMGLLGRKERLQISGLADTLERLKKMMDLFNWQDWSDLYPVVFNEVPEQEMSLVLENESMRIFSSPVQHSIPTIGLRIEYIQSGKTVAYSADTQPTEQMVHLAAGADALFHEATGTLPGHTSPAQAGEIARQAGAGALYLIHYSLDESGQEQAIKASREKFSGPVYLARDGMMLDFS